MRDAKGYLMLDEKAAGPAGILVDEHHAVMTLAQREALMEYSTSVPTGAVPGKRWLRDNTHGTRHEVPAGKRWYMGEYVVSAYDEAVCAIHWRKILLVD